MWNELAVEPGANSMTMLMFKCLELQRSDIFVEGLSNNIKSSGGAKIKCGNSGVFINGENSAPSELVLFFTYILQKCRSYGAKKNSTPNFTEHPQIRILRK